MHKIRRTVRRRRQEGKTDYKLRMGLLKSEKPRLVFRKTSKYIIGQIIVSEIAQDRVMFGVTSKDLIAQGWPEKKAGSLKNLAACYLTGYMLAKKAKDVEGAVFDIGLNRNIKKSRIYAFLKGAVDGGLNVPHSEEALPEMEMIEEKDTEKMIKKLKESLENFPKRSLGRTSSSTSSAKQNNQTSLTEKMK